MQAPEGKLVATIKPRLLIGPAVIVLGFVAMIGQLWGGLDEVAGFSQIGPWLFVIGLVLVVIGILLVLLERDRNTTNLVGNRWAAPMILLTGILGLVWLLLFYAFSGSSSSLPVISELGNWNMAVGMGFIIAAFGFATKWE